MEIELYQKLPSFLDAIDRLGDTYARSGMFRCTRVEQGRTIVVMCMTMGITPIEFLATYDLIDGVPRKKALACLADFKKRGGRWKWLCEADDLEQAVGEFSFEGQTYTVKFTIEDAKRQGLVKPNSGWVKTPPNMLRARVITTAIGMLAPEIVAGADTTMDGAETTTQPAMLNLAQTAASLPPSQTAALPAPAPTLVVDMKTEEKELADMGLAPSQPAKTNSPAADKVASTANPIPTIEPGEEPMPPPTTIEPELLPDERPRRSVPTPSFAKKNKELDPDTVAEMGRIFADHFVEVSNWMIENGWTPKPATPLKTETQAAVYLEQNLRSLTRAQATRVLTKKMGFMKPVEEISP